MRGEKEKEKRMREEREKKDESEKKREFERVSGDVRMVSLVFLFLYYLKKIINLA